MCATTGENTSGLMSQMCHEKKLRRTHLINFELLCHCSKLLPLILIAVFRVFVNMSGKSKVRGSPNGLMNQCMMWLHQTDAAWKKDDEQRGGIGSGTDRMAECTSGFVTNFRERRSPQDLNWHPHIQQLLQSDLHRFFFRENSLPCSLPGTVQILVLLPWSFIQTTVETPKRQQLPIHWHTLAFLNLLESEFCCLFCKHQHAEEPKDV